jgi:hypothetical protein
MSELSKAQIKLQKQLLSKFTFSIFKMLKIPLAFFAGIKAYSLDQYQCTTTVNYKHLNTNPFKSMYFAVLAMTAELSTGALALFGIAKHKESIAVLLVKSEGEFYKKALGKITFLCKDGQRLQEEIDKSVESKEAGSFRCHTIGYDVSGDKVCEYYFTWSFKVRSKK